MYQANTLLFGNNSHFGKEVITPPFNTLVGPWSNSYQCGMRIPQYCLASLGGGHRLGCGLN